MGSVDDAKAAVQAAQSSLDTANAVLADVEGDNTVKSVTVTGVTIHYSDGSSTEFALEDAGTGLPPTGAESADSSAGDSPASISVDPAPADSAGESTAPDAPAGTIPE